MCVCVFVSGRKTRSKAAAIVLVKKKKKEFGSWPLSAAYIKYVAAAATGGMGWGLLKRVWKEEEEGAEARSRFSRGL